MSKKTTKSEQAGPAEAPEEQRREPRVMSPDEAYEAARKAEKKKRPDVAEELYRKILDARPDHGKSLHALALIALKSDRINEALGLLRKAVALQPEKGLIHYHLALVFEQQALYYEAEMAARHAITLDPEAWKLHQLLGKIMFRQDRFEEAVSYFEKALEYSPDNPELINQAGVAYHHDFKYALAEDNYRKALALRPDNVEFMLNLGTTLIEQDRPEEGEPVLSRAMSLQPDSPRVLQKHGRALLALERGDEARQLFERCLEIEPDEIMSHYFLSTLHSFEIGDPMLLKLQRLNEKLQEDPNGRAYILTALGNAMDQLGDFDAAFRYFDEANRIRVAERYHPNSGRESCRRIVQTFDAGLLARATPWEDPERIPVFVLGTPRSGKSLVEKLLKQHPEVAGLGENKNFTVACQQVIDRAGIEESYPQAVSQLKAAEIARAGRRYLELTRGIGPDRRFLVNTLPGHDRFVGFIAMALPHARLISIERDPMDVCLQMFCKHFANGNVHALDLENLGTYFAQHQYVMRHWRQLLGKRLLNLSYESLVSDTGTAWRRLEAHCGLPPAEVDSLQFRQDYIGIAKKYARHLKPLQQAIVREEARLAST